LHAGAVRGHDIPTAFRDVTQDLKDSANSNLQSATLAFLFSGLTVVLLSITWVLYSTVFQRVAEFNGDLKEYKRDTRSIRDSLKTLREHDDVLRSHEQRIMRIATTPIARFDNMLTLLLLPSYPVSALRERLMRLREYAYSARPEDPGSATEEDLTDLLVCRNTIRRERTQVEASIADQRPEDLQTVLAEYDSALAVLEKAAQHYSALLAARAAERQAVAAFRTSAADDGPDPGTDARPNTSAPTPPAAHD
jgi:hypothetical protein